MAAVRLADTETPLEGRDDAVEGPVPVSGKELLVSIMAKVDQDMLRDRSVLVDQSSTTVGGIGEGRGDGKEDGGAGRASRGGRAAVGRGGRQAPAMADSSVGSGVDVGAGAEAREILVDELTRATIGDLIRGCCATPVGSVDKERS